MLLWLYWLISNGLIFAGSPSLQDLGSGRKHQSSKLSFFTVASFAVTSRPKGVGCVFACSTASGKVQAQLYIEIFGMMSSEKINNKNLAWCDLKGKRMFPSWFKVWSSSWHSPMGGHSLWDRTNQSLLTKSMCLLIWLQFFEHFDDCSHLWRSMIPFGPMGLPLIKMNSQESPIKAIQIWSWHLWIKKSLLCNLHYDNIT